MHIFLYLYSCLIIASVQLVSKKVRQFLKFLIHMAKLATEKLESFLMYSIPCPLAKRVFLSLCQQRKT